MGELTAKYLKLNSLLSKDAQSTIKIYKNNNMKKTILLLALVTVSGLIFAKQEVSSARVAKKGVPVDESNPKKTTTSGTIGFNATTDKDAKPKAENKTVIATVDIKKGLLKISALKIQ